MRESSRETESPGLNSAMNQHQFLHEMLHPSSFDPTSSHDEFLEQMLLSVPPSAASFPWADDHPPPANSDDHSAALLASRMRHHQISGGAAKALMLQQQLLLSRGFAAATAPTHHDDRNDVVDSPSPNSANQVCRSPPFFPLKLRVCLIEEIMVNEFRQMMHRLKVYSTPSPDLRVKI